ncbi:response regulator transcription factor [Tuberibacillus sp. Marseille-P3662]|uniref:response regulator transcription factor n=1 Tax=Tuberibacillus sp. Marseille-P3662 TaxID=1965358 RepID=UPI000A1CC60F|nr:response regulator transcription factor [Tuberibacillus sp. Marseille-P3662]
MAKRILVVDDEPSIVTLLKYNLEKAGYEVVAASTGPEALEVALQETIDLMVLDLMLPDMDGMDVCRKMRQQQALVPILMLTAKDDELNKIIGLENGADDYMTKPFSPREVTARVKAILRRVNQSEQTTEHKPKERRYTVGDVVVYPDNYEATFKGEYMTLTPKELELLVYLIKHKGRVLKREQLLSAVWNYDFAGDTRIVDVHVSHLREKIEIDTRKPRYIKTIRGLGYKFEDPTS